MGEEGEDTKYSMFNLHKTGEETAFFPPLDFLLC